MTKRFFKLLYVLALIALALSLPITLLINIHPDEIVRTTYKAKCLSNNQYVVLEGSPLNEAYEFDEFILNDTTFSDTKQTLNLYCRYYDQIQPYITEYVESKTPAETRKANADFFTFRNSVESSVYSYPALYSLEVVSNITQWNVIYNPIIGWFVCALLAFIVLQALRMCYVYVVFGKVVWHPFKRLD